MRARQEGRNVMCQWNVEDLLVCGANETRPVAPPLPLVSRMVETSQQCTTATLAASVGLMIRREVAVSLGPSNDKKDETWSFHCSVKTPNGRRKFQMEKLHQDL